MTRTLTIFFLTVLGFDGWATNLTEWRADIQTKQGAIQTLASANMPEARFYKRRRCPRPSTFLTTFGVFCLSLLTPWIGFAQTNINSPAPLISGCSTMLSIELSDHLSLMKRLAERGFYRSVASRLVKTNPEIARRIIVDPDVKPVFVYRGLNGITAQQFNPRFTKHFFGPEYEVNATTFFETALRD